MREGFGKKSCIAHQTKLGSWDVVTKYDLDAERFIIEKIKKKFSNHGILAEETGQIGSKSNFWIIDPLDGTHAFLKGIPQFCTTFSFVRNGKLEAGVVYDPMADELFFARESRGATLNGTKIAVNKKRDILYAGMAPYFTTSFASTRDGRQWRKLIYNRLLLKNVMWMEMVSSDALASAYLACGRYDIVLSMGFKPWDLSAGCLIAKEAGAKVTDVYGRSYRWHMTEVIAANPVLHKKVLEELGR